MKKIVHVLGIVVVLMSFSEISFAQGGASAVPFLLISPTSRASGMGEGGVAFADDASAIHWNPAGLAFQKGSEASITHANWLPQFHLSDLFYDYFNYKQDVPEFSGTVAADITYLNLGEFIITSEKDPTPIGKFKGFEVAVPAGYGTLLTDELGLGLNLRFINSSLSPIGTAQEKGSGIAYNIAGDIGILYRPKHLVLPFLDEDIGNYFTAGANLSNLGPKVVYIDAAQADPMPTTLRVGIGVIPMFDEFNELNISFDFSRLLVQRNNDNTSDPLPKSLITSFTKPSFDKVLKTINSSIGLEYWYKADGKKLIALRTGYFWEDPSFGNRNFMTFGAGIRYDIYGFDFSYISAKEENSPLSDTLRFTLLILWGMM